MPVYEYRCAACRGRFQKLVWGFHDPDGLACPRCGGTNLHRLVSRFATLTSEEARADALADPATFAGLDETDPRSIATWAKRLGKELGDDAGDDWNEMVDQMLEEELQGEGDGQQASSTAGAGDDLGWG